MNPSHRSVACAALVSLLVLAACSGDDDNGATDTVVDTTTTTIREQPVSDGQLVIGALLPISDSVIGQPMQAAVETAVERINTAGGVFDRPVRLVVADEGSSTATATTSIQTLLDSGVDAVVGPASSITALSTLERLVSADVVTCSPTASALSLDAFPDDGLFFRTVPSDSLQARAIAEAADQTGAQRVTIAHVDDAYGRGFADATETWLGNLGVTVVEQVPFATDDDNLTDEAGTVADADAQVAIVLADANDVTRFLEALDDQDTSDIATVVVNDALRNPAAPQRIEALEFELAHQDPRAGDLRHESSRQPGPVRSAGLFAANAYDCANLIALSAVRSDSDAARDIAATLAQVSVSGSLCRTFAECTAAIESGLEIDYNGPSGITELQARNGDPSRAVFSRFIFDASGVDVLERSVVVGG